MTRCLPDQGLKSEEGNTPISQQHEVWKGENQGGGKVEGEVYAAGIRCQLPSRRSCI